MRKFGTGKMRMVASMLALAFNSATSLGKEFNKEEEESKIRQQMRHMRSGFTSSPDKRKARNRRRSAIAFESRRRNRK